MIVYLHRIVENTPGPLWHEDVSLHRDAFEDLLERLASAGPALTPADYLARRTTGTLPEGAHLVTFDDGYRDTLEVALPVLERRRVPCAVFVTTGFLLRHTVPGEAVLTEAMLAAGGPTPPDRRAYDRRRVCVKHALPAELPLVEPRVFPPAEHVTKRLGELFLDKDGLRQLVKSPLVTLGAHGHSHRPFPTLEDAELAHELERPRIVLEKLSGVPVRLLSHPYGASDARVPDAANRAGYTEAFATESGKGCAYTIPRQDARRLPVPGS